MTTFKWDVFISHASEDKESVARPLSEKLKAAGLEVWLDENELTIGDSLRSKIDHGLAESRYGIVILSPAFFGKEWPQNELNGLFALESGRGKVILPVWHNVDKIFIAKYSPLLADRLGSSTSPDLNRVCEAILQAIRSDKKVLTIASSATTQAVTSKRFLSFRWLRWIIPILVMTALAGAWAIRRDWTGDKFAQLRTQEIAATAGESFRTHAKAAGYADAEVLESWFGDFLFEHWISGQTIHELLTRKAASHEHGDTAIGIWSSTDDDARLWNVRAGLARPNERPVFLSGLLTMRSRTVEPRSGPHRENAAGLSVVGSQVVLGVYTNTYRASADWICANFAPQSLPFIDSRPITNDFERLEIRPESPQCPAINFLSVRKRDSEMPVDRFRTLLNLPVLAQGQEPDETIYVSISKASDSYPTPVRAFLLWLRLPKSSAE